MTMLRRALLVLACLLVPSVALAQGCGPSNPNCTVATVQPFTTSDNRAASTAFVQGALAGGGNLPLSNGELYVGNASNIAIARALSGDCAITNMGAITCTKTNGVPLRIKLTADTTLQANSSTGNDSNPCTVASPCLTGQHLYDIATQSYDRSGFKLTLQAVGTFTPGSGITFMSMLGSQVGNARQGQQGTGLIVDLSAATLNMQNANAFACDQFCSVVVNGNSTGIINLNGGTGNQGNAIISDNGGNISLIGVTVAGTGNCVGQSNLNSQIAVSNITVSGTYSALLCLADNATGQTSGTITNSGTPTFSSAYITLNAASLTMDGTTIVGSITGAQYFMRGASSLSINAVSLPGTSGINQGGWVGLNPLPATAGGSTCPANQIAIGQGATTQPICGTVPNAAMTNSTITVGGTSAALGTSVSVRGPLGAGTTNTLAQSSTAYFNYAGAFNASQAFAATAPYVGTLRNLSVNLGNAPASGQTVTVTLLVGTYAQAVAGTLPSTSVTCTVSNPNTQCQDNSNSAAISANSAYNLKFVTSATTGTINGGSWGLEMDTP